VGHAAAPGKAGAMALEPNPRAPNQATSKRVYIPNPISILKLSKLIYKIFLVYRY